MQEANLLTSDKVAALSVFHPISTLVRKEVNFPAEGRIRPRRPRPGDRVVLARSPPAIDGNLARFRAGLKR